ncbi:hypothetical protein [Quadrisphaera sp. KR29]|uniref:hypothetical protein n=1 Tax=Quadrisphaera sp. KR29 TaxID=3461391 RepID=UPI004043DFFE
MKRSPLEKRARRRLAMVTALAGLAVGAGAGAAYATDAHGTRTIVETGWATVVDQRGESPLALRSSDVASVGNSVIAAVQGSEDRDCPWGSGGGSSAGAASSPGSDGPASAGSATDEDAEAGQPTVEQIPSADL